MDHCRSLQMQNTYLISEKVKEIDAGQDCSKNKLVAISAVQLDYD